MKNLRLTTIIAIMLAAIMLGGNYASAKKAQGDFKVVSYNIRLSVAAQADGDNCWENRKQASIKMVNEQKPLIMGLQEACPDQIEYLNTNLKNYKYIGVGRDDGKREGEVMAIYYDASRVNLLQGGTFWLSQTPDSVSFGWDAACRRTCTWGVFSVIGTDHKFCYFNTHLDHMGRVARREEIKLIVSKIQELAPDGMPVFLTADFNSSTTNAIFDPLKAVMNDARSTCGITDKKATFNGWGKLEESEINDENEVVIDHIFYKDVKPISFKVLDGNYGVPYISDHYPVVMTFRFK